MTLDIDVRIIRDVKNHLDDLAAGKLELWLVSGAHRVAAVIADTETFTAQREVPRLRLNLSFRDDLVIDVQLEWAIRLVTLALSLLYEIHTDDVFAWTGRWTSDVSLGWDTKEVVGVC